MRRLTAILVQLCLWLMLAVALLVIVDRAKYGAAPQSLIDALKKELAAKDREIDAQDALIQFYHGKISQARGGCGGSI